MHSSMFFVNNFDEIVLNGTLSAFNGVLLKMNFF